MQEPKLRLLLVFLFVVGAAGCDQRSAAPAQPQTPVIAAGEIGSPLPDFVVKDLSGQSISSSDLKGKVVLIDFWATWCQPCKKEMPGYQKLLDRYGSRGFAVLGLKSDIMADSVNPLQFAKKIGVRYPLIVASASLTHKFGGIEGLPTTMIYDRHGLLRKKVIGFDYTENFEASLKPLL
jgi:thiol-disulfide isomerase/thioredoxin